MQLPSVFIILSQNMYFFFDRINVIITHRNVLKSYQRIVTKHQLQPPTLRSALSDLISRYCTKSLIYIVRGWYLDG